MAKKRAFSENGLPWTSTKITNAIKNLKNEGSVGFAFGFEEPEILSQLNEKIFSVREDLILHIWSVSPDNKFTKEQLTLISTLQNVRKLKLSGFNNSNLAELEKLTSLNKLIIGSNNSLDISFIEKLSDIKYLFLSGKFKDLSKIEFCKNLEELYLQQLTINDLSFISTLKKLSYLMIDSSRVNCSFEPLQNINLTVLTISSITNLSDISFLSKMEKLEELRVDASKVEYLPDFTRLDKLETLKLKYMKIWKNPEIIQTIKSLKKNRITRNKHEVKGRKILFSHKNG